MLRLAKARAMSKDGDLVDYRYIGPVTECPVCMCEWFEVPMTLDKETQLPGLIGLDVACYSCGAIVKLATPLDRILREEVADEEEEFEE